jgi:hypothetical protein
MVRLASHTVGSVCFAPSTWDIPGNVGGDGRRTGTKWIVCYVSVVASWWHATLLVGRQVEGRLAFRKGGCDGTRDWVKEASLN